jgi:hypothetical protein
MIDVRRAVLAIPLQTTLMYYWKIFYLAIPSASICDRRRLNHTSSHKPWPSLGLSAVCFYLYFQDPIDDRYYSI